MRHFIFFLPLFLVAFAAKSQIQVIPQPQMVEEKGSKLSLPSEVGVYYGDPDLEALQSFVDEILGDHKRQSKDLADVTLMLSDEVPMEGYILKIHQEGVVLTGGSPAGVFYGLQTLRQLADENGAFPTLHLEDAPKFGYRGMHLDVARHFFPVSFIKKYLDVMSLFKMNRFHWHLTEDQGWRIEIKQYPRLTAIGAWRDSTVIGRNSGNYERKRYGGYYTQEEIREVVAYASERFITVVPEIEMPGHSSAALAAYPQLGCKDTTYQVATRWGVFEDIYCPSEETFEFLENVLTEVMDLFPGEYLHIGGDEAPKKQWEESELAQSLIKREGLADEHELQSYFIRRIEKFLNRNGRQIIGWDEILEGGLAPNATVMSWRGTAGGIAAARQQHQVVMTPTSHCYFDYYQRDPDAEPLAIGGFTPLEKVYRFDPIPAELSAKESQYIWGAQGNVWTEYMKTSDQVEYMAFPRAIALAEVVWSYPEERNFGDFVARLRAQIRLLDQRSLNYAPHFLKE
jgi:hexosaminidase